MVDKNIANQFKEKSTCSLKECILLREKGISVSNKCAEKKANKQTNRQIAKQKNVQP